MKQLGTLKGPLLIFGGVFSNLQALKEIQKIANRLDVTPTNIICLGDVVGCFAQPEESLQRLRKWGISCVAGQTEMLLRNRQRPVGNGQSFLWPVEIQDWFPYTERQLSRASHEWLNDLPVHISFQYYGKKFVALYGSYHRIADYIFKSTPWKIKEHNFRDSRADVILAGHSGLPFHHLKKGKIWLNPGHIGVPANDGTSRGWYLYLNFNEEWGETEFEHRSFHFDIDQTISQVHAQQQSQSIAEVLKTGLWNNTEYLPAYEAGLQGKELAF